MMAGCIGYGRDEICQAQRLALVGLGVALLGAPARAVAGERSLGCVSDGRYKERVVDR